MDMLRVEKESSRSQPIATKLDYIHDHQDLFSILCLCSLIKNQNHRFVIVTHTRAHTHVEHMTHMTYPQKLLSLFS